MLHFAPYFALRLYVFLNYQKGDELGEEMKRRDEKKKSILTCSLISLFPPKPCLSLFFLEGFVSPHSAT